MQGADAEPEPEPDADLDLMWQRARPSPATPSTPADTPRLKFPSLELNEAAPDSTLGSERVDAVLASASHFESSSAVLPALLSLDELFEECLRPHPALIAALARTDSIATMIGFSTFGIPDIGTYNADRLAFASCKLLSCGWWGRMHGVLDVLVSSEPLEALLEYPSRVETPMDARAGFYWACIMRTVLNEKHAEVLHYLKQDPRALVSMLSSLAAHAASETEAGPLLWEMLTDEELAEAAAMVGAAPHIASALLSSLQAASANADEEAMCVGARLIVSMLELGHGHRTAPHFRDAMVALVPAAASCFGSSAAKKGSTRAATSRGLGDPARVALSLADVLLAVLSPVGGDSALEQARLPVPQTSSAAAGDGSSDRGGGAGVLAATGADGQQNAGEEAAMHACQGAVINLLRRFLTIGEQDGTSLVRQQRRQASFQFTVMRPRAKAKVSSSVEGGGRSGRGSPSRQRIGTAELACVRAVGRLLQGEHRGYNLWIAGKFAELGLGDHCVALLSEYEAAPTDLLHYALVEVLKAAIVGGDLSVAENILLSGTMGGLARFMVSTFRKVPRGICAAHMVELANMVESAPELSEILHRSLPTWAEFVGVEIALENEKRRHVFDQQDQYGDQYGELG